MFDLTELEILNIIKNLDSSKVNGYNSISVKIIKKVNSIVCKVLHKLINKAYFKIEYPNSLKLTKVILIFK